MKLTIIYKALFLRILIPFVVFTLLFTSCIDDEAGAPLEFSDVEMVIKGKYDGNPLVKNRVYAYNDGSRVKFSAFNFFVSGLNITVNANENFAMDEIEFIDLALFEGEEAALSGYKVFVGRAPIDEYNGFSFDIGVSPELNSTKPDEYGESHPLANEAQYDENLNGYKFLNIAGQVDYNSDNTYDADFDFFIAFDQNLRTIPSTQSLEIIADVTNTIEMDVDLRKILDSGIRTIDFSNQLTTSPNPSDEIMLLLNSNIAGAITVK